MYLPYLTLGLILICGCHARSFDLDYFDETQDALKRNKVEEFLESFKEVLRNGNSTWGIPRLDPFIREHMAVNVTDDMINLDAELWDVDVRGLSEYNVIKGKFSLIGFKLNISLAWPLVYATTNYSMQGLINKEYPIYGTGNIKAAVKDFAFAIDLAFRKRGEYLYVNFIDTRFSLRALDFVATGLLNDEETSQLVSTIISDVAPSMIKDYQDEIKARLNPMIREQLDGFLSKIKLKDLIKIFG